MSLLKPGVSVILTSEGRRGGGLACKGSIYEADEDRIVASQTFPPLNKSRLNEQLSLTFPGRKKDRVERFGFLVEFLPDRQLENELNRKLKMIQRRILAQGCILGFTAISTIIPFINFT